MLFHVLLVLVLACCTYTVYLRAYGIARDVYYGTGSAKWFWFCGLSVVVWSFIGLVCLMLLCRA